MWHKWPKMLQVWRRQRKYNDVMRVGGGKKPKMAAWLKDPDGKVVVGQSK